MTQFQYFGQDPEPQNTPEQQARRTRLRSTLNYMNNPEVFSRIRRLGVHFGYFAWMIAMIFGSVKLIQKGHPALNPANIGQFGILQVIGIAASNLTWSRKHIDQIGIFSAIVIGIFVMIAQVFLILAAVVMGFNPAEAQTTLPSGDTITSFFTPVDNQFTQNEYTACADPMMIFFAQVFGNLNGFWECNFIAGHGQTLAGENLEGFKNLPVFSTQTIIHDGIYVMLSVFSYVTMIIAVIVVLYYVVMVVAESAQTGTPFGNRFNSVWAPIRLVIALGLLIPLGGSGNDNAGAGLNSAQWIVLWLAKQGSNLGTLTWQMAMDKFEIFGGDGEDTDKMNNYVEVSDFVNANWVRELAFKTLVLETCMAAQNRYEGRDEIKVYYFQRDEDHTFTVVYGELVETAGGGGEAYSGSARRNFSKQCGRITVTMDQDSNQATAIGQAYKLSVDQAFELSISIVRQIAMRTNSQPIPHPGASATNIIRKTARDIAYTYIHGMGMDVEEEERIDEHAANVFARLFWSETGLANTIIEFADEVKENVLSTYRPEEVEKNIDEVIKNVVNRSANSFVYAGIWFLDISRVTQSLKHVSQGMAPNLNIIDLAAFKGDYDGWSVTTRPYNTRTPEHQNFMFRISWEPAKATYISFIILDHALKNYHPLLKNTDLEPGTEWIQEQCNGALDRDQYGRALACNVGIMLAGKHTLRLASDDPEDRTLDPVTMLVMAGSDIMERALNFVSIGLVAAFGGGLAAATQIPFLSQIGSIAETVGGIMILVGLIGIVPGFILYYILPVLPFFYFILAVINWGMEVALAIIGAPFFALSWLKIDGDGLPTDGAYSGILKLLMILTKPALIVISFILSVLLLGAGVFLMQTLFHSVLTVNNAGGINAVEALFFHVIFAYIVYSFSLTCFKLVEDFANQADNYLQQGGIETFSESQKTDPMQSQELLMAAGGIIGGQLSSQVSSAASGAGQGLGQPLAKSRQRKEDNANQAAQQQQQRQDRYVDLRNQGQSEEQALKNMGLDRSSGQTAATYGLTYSGGGGGGTGGAPGGGGAPGAPPPRRPGPPPGQPRRGGGGRRI